MKNVLKFIAILLVSIASSSYTMSSEDRIAHLSRVYWAYTLAYFSATEQITINTLLTNNNSQALKYITFLHLLISVFYSGRFYAGVSAYDTNIGIIKN
jgi:cytochrome b subunit of formate dehydrogenase